jgi:NAD(P)H-hydrate epimerase
VVPIGIPEEAITRAEPNMAWFDDVSAYAHRCARPAQSHKGLFGHLLVVAGSTGKTGAASLVAEGALRSGVGLVTAAAPLSIRAEIAGRRSEVMTEPLAETVSGSLSEDAADTVRNLVAARDALAIGPGLGTDDETVSAVVNVLTGADTPTVVDADALNALAARGPETIRRIGTAGPRVLTPHPGEAARLVGTSTPEIQADRPAAAREIARMSGCVVTLKGHRTVVAHPDGRLSFNATGNPAMATGGTGDVLTGVIGALLARGLVPWDAARLGVWIHGRAGDLAAEEIGPAGIVAGDLTARIPRALDGDRRKAVE